MSNPYENPDTDKTVAIKKGLTWAEYSILVALICIVGAFAYSWHVKTQTNKMIKDAAIEVELALKLKTDAELKMEFAITSKNDAESKAKEIEIKVRDAEIKLKKSGDLIAEINKQLAEEKSRSSGIWARFGKELDAIFK